MALGTNGIKVFKISNSKISKYFHIFRSTLIGVLSYSHGAAAPFDAKKICDPKTETVEIYARITEEIVEWIRKKTERDGAKKSNCADI